MIHSHALPRAFEKRAGHPRSLRRSHTRLVLLRYVLLDEGVGVSRLLHLHHVTGGIHHLGLAASGIGPYLPASTFRIRLLGRPVGFNPASFCASLIAAVVWGPTRPSASPL